jgi:hypothetical protein
LSIATLPPQRIEKLLGIVYDEPEAFVPDDGAATG